MSLSDSRKGWLYTNFFPSGTISTTSLLNAIVSDLDNSSDTDVADIEWIYSSLGSIYTPPAIEYEQTGKISSIDSGNSLSILVDCPLGQICDLTPKYIILNGVVTTADNDADAKAWLKLHLPVGSTVSMAQITGNQYILTKGTEIINDSLNSYISNLAQVTPATGAVISARVLSITDGDTFEASQVCPTGQLCVTTAFTVRLEGISASELSFTSGRTAKTWLSEHIPPGSVVTLTVKGSDTYGRQVCQVVNAAGQNINQLMVLEGQGEVYNPSAESFKAKQIGIQLSGCRSSNAPVSTLPTLEMVGPVCNYIKAPPSETWFGYKVRNTGASNWKGWLGVKVYGSAGNYEYTGSTLYQTTVKNDGQEVTLWARFVVPSNIGNVTHWDAIIQSND